MAAGMRTAVSVPLSLMRAGDECWPHLLTLAAHGNIQTMCDLRVSELDNLLLHLTLSTPWVSHKLSRKLCIKCYYIPCIKTPT